MIVEFRRRRCLTLRNVSEDVAERGSSSSLERTFPLFGEIVGESVVDFRDDVNFYELQQLVHGFDSVRRLFTGFARDFRPCRGKLPD